MENKRDVEGRTDFWQKKREFRLKIKLNSAGSIYSYLLFKISSTSLFLTTFFHQLVEQRYIDPRKWDWKWTFWQWHRVLESKERKKVRHTFHYVCLLEAEFLSLSLNKSVLGVQFGPNVTKLDKLDAWDIIKDVLCDPWKRWSIEDMIFADYGCNIQCIISNRFPFDSYRLMQICYGIFCRVSSFWKSILLNLP